MGAGFNGTRKVIDIPASSGAFLPILATGLCRRVVVEESPITAEGAANTLVGLIDYQIPNDNFATTLRAIGANDETSMGQIVPASFELSDSSGYHGPTGSVIGNGPGVLLGIGPTPATTLCNVRSGGAATSVVVTQYY